LVYIAFVFSVLVSYTRARAEGLDVDCTVGIMTRPERVIVLAVGLIVGHWVPFVLQIALGIVAALSALTSVHRVLHTKAALRDRA
jgi:CDP-diacylglycerol--glycerol-3-phosphate 3-phosphatidyltransferase